MRGDLAWEWSPHRRKQRWEIEKDMAGAPGANRAWSQISPRVLVVWASKFILSVQPVWVGFIVTCHSLSNNIPLNCEALNNQNVCFLLFLTPPLIVKSKLRECRALVLFPSPAWVFKHSLSQSLRWGWFGARLSGGQGEGWWVELGLQWSDTTNG